MKKIIGALLVLTAFLPAAAQSQQDTLRGDYSELRLSGKRYFIAEVITVAGNFVVEPGAQIIFNSGASLVCRGSVQMDGTPERRIVVQSVAARNGQGIIVAGNSNKDININHTRFESLTLPLNFEFGWYRSSVTVANSEFVGNVGSTAVIQVVNPGYEGSSANTVFSLYKNLFTENQAPIYFEDLVSDRMQINIVGNAFVQNRMMEYGKYTFSSNVLFGRMDKTSTRFLPFVTGNSFVGNVLWDNNADTVLHAANFGVYGSCDSLKVPGNYWGATGERNIRKTVYDYSVNYTSPKLVVDQFLTEPPDTIAPHIFKTDRLPIRESQRLSYRVRDGKWKQVIDSIGTQIDERFSLQQGLQSLQLTANRIVDTKKMKVHLFYLADSLRVIDTLLAPKIDSTADKRGIVFEFNYHVDSLFRTKTAYLAVTGIEGKQGEYIAETKIGYPVFLQAFNKEKLKYELRSNKKDSSEVARQKLPPPVQVTTFKKRYELGFMGAYALYYGTLSNRSLFKNDFNSFVGLQFRYNLKSHMSVSLSFMKMTLTGSDLKSGDTVKIARGMSFITPVTNLSLQVEYDFFDNQLYSTNSKIRPSIGFGIDYIKFNPKGEYLGELYDLQPLGTGGQNLAGATNAPYALSSFGAPVTAQVRYLLNKKWIFSLFGTYHLAFTDYLDDVGPDVYPDQALLSAANPSKADAASYFANPTRRAVSKTQLRSGLSGGSDGFFTFGFTLAYHF